jgi:hypothetical protein
MESRFGDVGDQRGRGLHPIDLFQMSLNFSCRPRESAPV